MGQTLHSHPELAQLIEDEELQVIQSTQTISQNEHFKEPMLEYDSTVSLPIVLLPEAVLMLHDLGKAGYFGREVMLIFFNRPANSHPR